MEATWRWDFCPLRASQVRRCAPDSAAREQQNTTPLLACYTNKPWRVDPIGIHHQ